MGGVEEMGSFSIGERVLLEEGGGRWQFLLSMLQHVDKLGVMIINKRLKKVACPTVFLLLPTLTKN
jgi:hypothetical protein